MNTLEKHGLIVTHENNMWYVLDLDIGDALMGEYFETELDAYDLLNWYINGMEIKS